MRIFLSKILLCISIGLLYYHQIVAHHHQDFEIASEHHSDSDLNTGHDEDHLPPHHIAHNFSSDQSKISVAKVVSNDIIFRHQFDFAIVVPEPLLPKKEYIEIRPPDRAGYTYFSLRAPPSAA